MDWPQIIENKVVVTIISAVIGAVIAIVTQRILNKRGTFSYNVVHNRVGVTTNDSIYGNVKVTWNDTSINHLYLSSLEIKNESMKDFESVVVRIYSTDTFLLTQRTQILGTSLIVNFTDEYQKRITVPEGTNPSDAQFELYRNQRDYLIPTINRNQILKFEFLNAAKTENQPSIWVDIQHKGLRCIYKKPVNMIWGVPQPYAVLYGTMIGLIGVFTLSQLVQNQNIAIISAFLIGWTVLIPGAVAIKAYRKCRELIAG